MALRQRLDQFLTRFELFMERVEGSLCPALAAPDWEGSVAFRYANSLHGIGVLEPVKNINAISLDSLKEIELQKKKLLLNTEQFVNGLPANNVLLTGARGTGKSSLVRAALLAYSARGLRLIEIDKQDLFQLPAIVNLVADRPEKFLIFCDDLSFEEGELGYKSLKSVLDGSVAASSPNVLIYATSNRRHLLPEYMSENLKGRQAPDGEIHPGEVVEEKISLSERFGLWISFYPFSQSEYLAVVDCWLECMGVSDGLRQEAHPKALIWALERGARNGRVAMQFARDYVGSSRLLG